MPCPWLERSPPSAAVGHLTSSCPARRQGARVRATYRDETPTARSINILQWNAQGVYNKIALAERLSKEYINVACLQEYHLKDNQHFTMRGYQVREGIAYTMIEKAEQREELPNFVKNTIPAQEFTVSINNQVEIHWVNFIVNNKQHKIFIVYSPSDRELSLNHMQLQDSMCIVLGDFNSHSEAWCYEEADRRGEEVEDWQVDNGLVLLKYPDPPTFFSRWWLSSTTPDLAFTTNDLSRIASRTVLSHLGGSDHISIKISLNFQYRPQTTNMFLRWNYKKGNRNSSVGSVLGSLSCMMQRRQFDPPLNLR